MGWWASVANAHGSGSERNRAASDEGVQLDITTTQVDDEGLPSWLVSSWKPASKDLTHPAPQTPLSDWSPSLERATTRAWFDAYPPDEATPSLYDSQISFRTSHSQGGLRYVATDLLGEGGMGKVLLCEDRSVGRSVAMKRIRPSLAGRRDARERFLREAQVQGRLEHPAVVPVYDVGLCDDGTPYFTMKRVQGRDLRDVIVMQGHHERLSLRRLLTAFSQVCLAMHFAHERGVVHRDLKPSNIMLGEFGEVYVLDWGVAKLSHEPHRVLAPDSQTLPLSGVRPTADGATVGTAGYSAPEQELVGAHGLDRRADVYSLGVILYELLSLQPLERMPNGDVLPPHVAAPERGIDLELSAICGRATLADRDERLASAHELHAALESYLDGRREDARRRSASRACSAAACQTLGSEPTHNVHEARASAMNEIGRALALDPHNQQAARLLDEALTCPPKSLPPESSAALHTDRAKRHRLVYSIAAFSYTILLLHGLAVVWMGVRNPWAFGVVAISTVVTIILSLWAARTERPTDTQLVAVFFSGCVTIASLSTLFGPFVFVPVLLAVHIAASLLVARNRQRPVIIALGLLSYLTPLALQWAGLMASSYTLHDGVLTVTPIMAELSVLPSWVLLIVGNFIALLTLCLFVSQTHAMLDRMQRRMSLQAWQLSQLVPRQATVIRPGVNAALDVTDDLP